MFWIYKDFFTKMRKNSIFEKFSKNFVDMTPRFQESGKGILDHLSSKYEVIWPDRSIQFDFAGCGGRDFREVFLLRGSAFEYWKWADGRKPYAYIRQ